MGDMAYKSVQCNAFNHVPRGRFLPKMVRRGVMANAMGRSAETMVRAPVKAVKLAADRVEVMFMGGMMTWSTT